MTFKEKINKLLAENNLQDAIDLMLEKNKDEGLNRKLSSLNSELSEAQIEFPQGLISLEEYIGKNVKISNRLKELLNLFDSDSLIKDSEIINKKYENQKKTDNNREGDVKSFMSFIIDNKKYFIPILFTLIILVFLFLSYRYYENKIEILNKRVISLSDSIIYLEKENVLILEELKQEKRISIKEMDSMKTILEEQKEKLSEYSKRLTVAENKLRDLSKSVINIKDLPQVENDINETKSLIDKFDKQNQRIIKDFSLPITRNKINTVNLDIISKIEKFREELNTLHLLFDTQGKSNEKTDTIITWLGKSENEYLKGDIPLSQMEEDLNLYKDWRNSLIK